MVNVGNDKFYVYGWYNDDWKAYFYIGKGCGHRCEQQNKNRSNMFKAILSKWKCHYEILKENLLEQDALDLEKRYKVEFALDGNPIINGEHEVTAKAIRDGKAKSREKGKKDGRPKVHVENFENYKKRVDNGELTVTQAVKELGISRRTWYNYEF